MAMFKGFKPQGLQKIATKMGYAGSMDQFDNFIKENPDKEREMIVFKSKAQEMARGGVVRKMAVGGQADARQLAQANVPTRPDYAATDTIGDVSSKMLQTPALPDGGATIPVGTQITADQDIDTTTGQVAGTVGVPTSLATTSTANAETEKNANLTTADKAATGVDSALAATSAAQMTLNDPRSQVLAAQQTASSVGNLSAAQGNATLMSNPVQRQIQTGEIITGSANAETASTYTEQIQAATATPTTQATVQGQLASLTDNFDASNPPSWAAGALRGIQAQMAARGLGASSIAGQAMVQGALESALPIAQADAQVIASFEAQNLTNRQQRAMLAAQQRATFIGQEFDQAFQARVQNSARIGDIANMNFTAEQQIALENSRAANTMELNNLSNRQGKVMAQAGALANLEQANLSNAQQAAVQNAQNFLAMDMQNLNTLQSSDVFRAQQRQQALFTDSAADNAAKQFNSTSKNQTNQFVASLQSNTDQFNAAQKNAMDAQNLNETNAMEKFSTEIMNQRDQFTAANQLVVDQNNAVWRREIATADTVAINRANELNAAATLDMSKTAFNNLWNYYGDTMEWAWTSAENQQERWNKLAQQQMINDTSITVAGLENDYQSSVGFGSIIGKFLTAGMFGL